MRAREGGVETISGEGKTELVMKKKGKHKSMTGVGVSLTWDYREKEESNKIKICFQLYTFT